MSVRGLAASLGNLWGAVGAGAAALTAYLLTMAPGLVPGRFAVETVAAMDAAPGLSVRHPLWLLTARSVAAAVPAAEQVYALNLFSAVCGALAVFCVACLMRRVIYGLICGFLPERMANRRAGRPDGAKRSNVDDPVHKRHQTLANWGGGLSAFALAFSAPFWVASRSLHSLTFDLLLFVLTAFFAIRYYGTGRIVYLIGATFLLFLGLVESVNFIWLFPGILFLLIRGGKLFGRINERSLLCFLVFALGGLGANTALYLLQSSEAQTMDMGVIRMLLVRLVRGHVTEAKTILFTRGWLLIAILTFLPLLVAVKRIIWFAPERTEKKRNKRNIVCLAFSVMVMLSLSPLPGAAWWMARKDGHLPVFMSLFAALAAGGFFAYWQLVKHESLNHDLETPVRNPRATRALCNWMCGLLTVAALGTVPSYLIEADGRKTGFADAIADVVLDQVEALGVKHLLTTGLIDMNLLARAHVRGLSLTVLPYGNPAVLSRPAITSIARLDRWMRANPDSSLVATMGCAPFWRSMGLDPVPCGLLFVAKSPAAHLEPAALRKTFDDTARQTVDALGKDTTMLPRLSATHKGLRTHVSRMANDLGTYYEVNGETPMADALYAEALTINDGNLCAVFNRYGLSRQHDLATKTRVTLADRTFKAVLDPGFSTGKLASEVERNGNLIRRRADTFVPWLLADWGDDESGRGAIKRVCGNWLLSRAARAPKTSSETSDETPKEIDMQSEVPRSSKELADVFTLIMTGRSWEAEARLRSLLMHDRYNLSAWALLADILLKRNSLGDIRTKILPSMRAAEREDAGIEDKKKTALTDLTAGCLHMREVPPDPAQARVCLRAALAKKKDMVTAQDLLLQASMLLGNIKQLEEDIAFILALAPNHARANAVLGNLMLAQNRVDEAERLYKISIAEMPFAIVRNDYSKLLRKQKRFSEAEEQARGAIQLIPAFAQAWDSLSIALLEQGRAEEAYQAVQCALVFEPQEVRLHLTLTRIYLQQKNTKDAKKTLARAESLLENSHASVRKAFEYLKQQVDSLEMP